jgi:hypothetical protein
MCDRPTWAEVLAFLRDNVTRSVIINIESDSTVAADQQQNQQQAMQFLEALGGFLQQSTAAAQQTPEIAPLMGKILGWGVRQFPIGRDLEESIDTAIDEMDAQVKKIQAQPPQQKPDPEMIKVQGMLQLEQAKAQGAMQLAQAKLQGEMQLKSMDMGQQHAADTHSAHHDIMAGHRDSVNDASQFATQAHIQAMLTQQAADQKAETAIIIAHINALAKIEAARIGADASADADAEAHEKVKGA